MDAEPPPLTPDVIATIERMAAQLADRGDHGDLAHRLEALIDLLVQNRQLLPQHRRWLEGLHGDRTQVKLAVGGDKRGVVSPDVDCAALLPLCKGRCCAMTVTLSREDLEEGRLRWNLHDPYVLAKDPATGYCGYLHRDGGCGAYHDRPATCRLYDCRRDPRVWIDYERRIAAPMPEPLVPIDAWPPDDDHGR